MIIVCIIIQRALLNKECYIIYKYIEKKGSIYTSGTPAITSLSKLNLLLTWTLKSFKLDSFKL